jgi:hypothetical protein
MQSTDRFHRFYRVLAVLLTAAIAGILVWQLAYDTGFFYHALAAAVVVVLALTLLLFLPFRPQHTVKKEEEEKYYGADEHGQIYISPDVTDSPAILRAQPYRTFRQPVINPGGSADENPEVAAIENPTAAKSAAEDGSQPQGEANAPSMPIVEDASSLTAEEKGILLNAVWYRCENPYCKYTRFLMYIISCPKKKAAATGWTI